MFLEGEMTQDKQPQCSNVVHTRTKVITKHYVKITSIRLISDCNIFTRHRFKYKISIANIHKQFTYRYYIMKLCPKSQNNLCKTQFKGLKKYCHM